MTITVSGQLPLLIPLTPGSPGCAVVSGSTRCTVSASLPVGTYPIGIALYGTPNGNTYPLALTSTVQTVVANTTNNLSFTLNAVVSLVFLKLSPDSAFASGKPQQQNGHRFAGGLLGRGDRARYRCDRR